MDKISPEEVRIAVTRFWTAFSGKSKVSFEGFYFPGSTVFSSSAPRTEPGQLSVTRRIRQFFTPTVSIKADLNSVEVQCISPNVAIATYVYAVQITSTNPDKSRTRRSSPFSRATQIFQRDETGALRIIHEHMSSATAPTVETITAQ